MAHVRTSRAMRQPTRTPSRRAHQGRLLAAEMTCDRGTNLDVLRELGPDDPSDWIAHNLLYGCEAVSLAREESMLDLPGHIQQEVQQDQSADGREECGVEQAVTDDEERQDAQGDHDPSRGRRRRAGHGWMVAGREGVGKGSPADLWVWCGPSAFKSEATELILVDLRRSRNCAILNAARALVVLVLLVGCRRLGSDGVQKWG